MYRLKKKFKNEKGQGLVEYGLILALVSIVAILVLSMLGGSIKGQLEEITASMGGISEPGKGPGDSDGEIEGPGDSDGEIEVPGYSNEEIEDLIKNHNFIPVATADELNNVRSATIETYGKGTKWEAEYTGGLNKKYIQVADIDLGKFTNFEPIGKRDSEFTGTFDGGGYVISNLTIDRVSESEAGLFGRAIGATFKNIGLVNVDVTGTGKYVGGLVGEQRESSTVTNSYATGSVTGRSSTGGLVGHQEDSSVSNSYSTGSVTGTITDIGGLVGGQFNSSVSDSYATGNVTSTGHGTGNNIGGLVGNQSGSSTVSDSYATGSVTGRSTGGAGNTGGLVGRQDGSSTTNSYATGSVTGTGDNIGGLVGYQWRTSTTNSYATGSVTGTGNYTSGLVGYQRDSSVSNSYATGSVTGESNTGGLVGGQRGSSSVSNGYWDKDTTKQEASKGGTGKTTEEMKNKDTYVDWDFESIWTIENNQYPTLR